MTLKEKLMKLGEDDDTIGDRWNDDADGYPQQSEIDEIRIRIRELDDAECCGLNVTAARTFYLLRCMPCRARKLLKDLEA
jgi:hypothetical protein